MFLFLSFIIIQYQENKNLTKTKNQNYINTSKEVNDLILMLDNSFLDQYPINNFQNMSDSKKTNFLINILQVNKKELTEKNIMNLKEKYFTSEKLKLNNVKCLSGKGNLYEYNEKEKTFTYNMQCQDLNKQYYSINAYSEESKKGKKLIVENWKYYRYLTLTTDNGNTYNNDIYGNINDLKNKSNPIYINTDADVFEPSKYETIKPKMEVIQYTFIKNESGNYYLEKITKK